MKYQPKTRSFPHQARATIQAVRHRNYAMFLEPRLGKTKAALDYVGILALKGEVNRVLVLCPAIAKQVWEEEIELHFPYWAHCETFDEEWYSLSKDKAIFETFQVQFFLAGREETFRRVQKNGKYLRPKQRLLEAFDPDVVIVDESHEYKRPGAVAAQDAWRMIRRLRKRRRTGMPFVLLLSGTPNPKGWLDLFAQFRIMDDSIFGSSVADFKENHVEYGHGKRKYTIIRYRNEGTLKRRVEANSIRVAADQAGLAGEQFWQTLSVDLPDSAKRIYLDLAAEFVAEWEGGLIDAANAGVKRIRLLQVTGGFTTDGQQIHDAKVRALRAYCRTLLEQEQAVVVYCRYSPEVQAARQALEKLDFTTGEISGRVSKKDRRLYLGRFRNSDGPQALVLQVQAGSVAIDLSRAAEAVYYSTPDGWVQYYQSLNRIRGPNQKRPVRFTHLVARGTLDTKVIQTLKSKGDVHAELMGNPKDFLGLI